MAHQYYKERVLPFVNAHPVSNPWLKVPFLGTQFELKELAETLRPDEVIRYITACKFNGGKRVLVCVTNLRFHVLEKGLVISKFQQSIDLSKISSVLRGRQLVFGTVDVAFEGNENPYTLSGFWLNDTENFQRALQDAVTEYNMGRAYENVYNQQPRQVYEVPRNQGKQRSTQPYMAHPRVASFDPSQGHVQPPVASHPRVSKADTADLDELKRRGLIDDWTYKRKVAERRGSL